MLKMIRQLLLWAPEQKRAFIYAALLKMVEAFFMGAPYFFVILTLNDLLANTLSVGKVVLYSCAMAGCFFCQGLFSYLFMRVIWPAANGLVRKLRLMLGEHLRKLSMGYFNDRSTGSLHTLIVDEMPAIQTVIYGAFPDFIVAISFATFVPIALLFIDWRLTLVTIAVIPCAIPFYAWNTKVFSHALQKRSDCLAELNTEVIEFIQGIEVLKGFGRTEVQLEKINGKFEDFRDLNKRIVRKGNYPITLGWIVLDLGICLIPLFATYFVSQGSVSLTVFLIFIILGLRLYEPIKLLLPAVAAIKLAEPVVGKIRAVFETAPLGDMQAGQAPDSFAVQFRNVSFRYGEKQVLKNVNFSLPEKTMTALVGPSGSGKTTITRLLARFWDVNSGEISIGGQDIRNIPIDTLLGRMSMVFQDVYLFNDTIYQNIAYGSKRADREQVIAAAKMARCHDFISLLPKGYDTMVGEGGLSLSGGERQRVSIARAILKDAPIILLDEATSSVDPENEFLLQSAINSLVESKTLIVIAHRLSTVVSADLIVVLNAQGQVEETGTHHELLQSGGLYTRFWESRKAATTWQLESPIQGV